MSFNLPKIVRRHRVSAFGIALGALGLGALVSGKFSGVEVGSFGVWVSSSGMVCSVGVFCHTSGRAVWGVRGLVCAVQCAFSADQRLADGLWTSEGEFECLYCGCILKFERCLVRGVGSGGGRHGPLTIQTGAKVSPPLLLQYARMIYRNGCSML